MYMQTIVELVLVVILIVVVLADSHSISNFFNSLIGKMLIISGVVFVSSYSKISALISVLIYICLTNSGNNLEGFDNNTSKSSDNTLSDTDDNEDNDDDNDEIPPGDISPTDDEMNFRKNHCKNGILVDSEGKKVEHEEIGVTYPNLNFDSDKCSNPCDENCSFTISTTSDQIGVEEQLKPKSSSELPVNPNQSAKDAQPSKALSSKEGFFSF